MSALVVGRGHQVLLDAGYTGDAMPYLITAIAFTSDYSEMTQSSRYMYFHALIKYIYIT